MVTLQIIAVPIMLIANIEIICQFSITLLPIQITPYVIAHNKQKTNKRIIQWHNEHKKLPLIIPLSYKFPTLLKAKQ